MIGGSRLGELHLGVLAVWVLFQTRIVLGRDDISGSTVKAFTPNEFRASYELMTQYKSGSVEDCPQVIEYMAVPTEIDQDLVIAHHDMKIGPERSSTQHCTDDGEMRLILSSNLVGDKLASFQTAISKDKYTSILFDDLRAQLRGKRYYVSISDSPRECGVRWFTEGERFIFFDESATTQLTVVQKISNGKPKLLSLPLIANIRYMISVGEGSTCIYRVDVDVSNIINDIARASDSPSPTVRRFPLTWRAISSVHQQLSPNIL